MEERTCGDCACAAWDYEESLGAKRWYFAGCRKGREEPKESCPEWEEKPED